MPGPVLGPRLGRVAGGYAYGQACQANWAGQAT